MHHDNTYALCSCCFASVCSVPCSRDLVIPEAGRALRCPGGGGVGGEWCGCSTLIFALAPSRMPRFLVEAILTLEVPCVIGGDFNALLEGDPLEVAFNRHGWTSPLAGVPTGCSLSARPPSWSSGVLWIGRLGFHLMLDSVCGCAMGRPPWCPSGTPGPSRRLRYVRSWLLERRRVENVPRALAVALAGSDPDAAWAVVQAAAREWHWCVGQVMAPAC